MPYIAGGELFTYLRTEGKLPEDHAMYATSLFFIFVGFTQHK
jgi:hypothetical protein